MSNLTPANHGAVTGGVRRVLRLEALAILAITAFAYFRLSDNPWLFAVLFFVPDLSFFAYAVNSRVGAVIYNAMHSYALSAILGVAGLLLGADILWQLSLVWAAHVAFDRSLGYGLKYASGFNYTHLGRVGKAVAEV